MNFSVQFFVLRVEYFYFCHIYSTVKREVVGSIIILADVRADTCTFAHPAGISGSDGCVAGSADSRAAYNGCMRPITENGEWGAKTKKVYVLDENGERVPLMKQL